MVDCRSLFEALQGHGVELFAGVPDSLLKAFCAYVSDHADPSRHVITANEGSAVAFVTGHYLATGNLGLVYMQNSGQGNAVNPLMSLAEPAVYGIPMLLVIGWRGEPGRKDEPQHRKQGEVTLPLLEALDVPYDVLPADADAALATVGAAVERAKRESRPVALVVRKGTFEPYSLAEVAANDSPLSREQAVCLLLDGLHAQDVVVSTTGKASRELFEYRTRIRPGPVTDFLTVGSMGHASQIALGVAEARPERQVFCLDGDGAAIMHLGSFVTVGSRRPANFKHVLLNNAAHDSVGGQPTAGFVVDFPAIARACGYRYAERAETEAQLGGKLGELQAAEGPAFLEVRCRRGARSDLGRPTTEPVENKEAFMHFLRS